mgnify:FL=1|tara:strand:- start:522 stop:983 length:462 start_codon:yes stop_codon:yes gene_type:complete
MITKEEVLSEQKQWSDGLLNIGRLYSESADYKQVAANYLSELYGFHMGEVLFKPTLASVQQFRLTKESALSYFIGGNSNFDEDNGFALLGWKAVRFENIGIKIEENIAIAMGNYFFMKENNSEVKVEYTFVYKKDDSGKLYIILHDSHFPYNS